MLHVLVRSPFTCGTFAACMRVIGAQDCLLLAGDAVYAALAGTDPAGRIEEAVRILGVSVHVLEPELVARGLAHRRLLGCVSVIDDGGFVDLTVAHHPVHTWS